MKTTETKWYVLKTYPGTEKKVADQLQNYKINNFLALVEEEDYTEEQKVTKKVPLLPSLIFIQTNQDYLPKVRSMKSVDSVLFYLDQPAVVREEEIELLKEITSELKKYSVEKIRVNPTSTPQQLLIPVRETEDKDKMPEKYILKVSFPSLGYMVSGEMQGYNIRVLNGIPDKIAKRI
jgi:transcription antitermination factor NusG